VELARRFNGEVINGDAMQMYQGLPIITNKITVEEQNDVPHHLLGVVGLDEETWTVGVFRRRAGKVIEEIRSRGRLPILVGGTHYYTQSLLFKDTLVEDADNGESPSNEHTPREEIIKKFPILDGPTEEALMKLREVDPIMADRWHPNDRRKILRSLEIYLTTGKRASDVYEAQQEASKGSVSDSTNLEESSNGILQSPTLLFWVHAEADVLKTRLDKRVDSMIKAGLLDEVTSLDQYLADKNAAGVEIDRSRGIWVSIGYKEFEKYLVTIKEGTATEDQLQRLLLDSIEQTKAATRQYAKRQVRWIRIKLLAALTEARAKESLYLLDGSDVTQWNTTVAQPAMEVTEKFLSGDELPVAAEMNEPARELLKAAKTDMSHRRDLWIRQTCSLCNMTAVTNEQWQTHLKSRTHRRSLKKAERRNAPNGQTPELEPGSTPTP
jgi:tRNA dimethylallyltransferase